MHGNDDESEIPNEKGFDVDSLNDCVWDRNGQRKPVSAYWVTLKEILFDSGSFFSKLPPDGPYREPFLFALITAIVAFLGVEFFQLVKDWFMGDLSSQSSNIRKSFFLGQFELRDLFKGVSIVLVGSMVQVVGCHLCLRRLCQNYQGFRATWRVFFYSQATQIAYMMPFIGNSIGPVWYAVVLTVGLAKTHSSRIETALFGPLVIASTTVFMQIILQIFIFWLTSGNFSDTKLLWSFIIGWM